MTALGVIPGPATLSRILDKIYSRVDRPLRWKEKLTSVWRPHYAPFDSLLAWVEPGRVILDIGCGSGAFLFLVDHLRRPSAAHGIDVNPEAIALGKAASAGGSISFEVMLEASSTMIEQASVITLIDVLHHVPRSVKPALLQSLLSSMRPGTRVIVKDLDPYPRWRALANRITDYASTRSFVDYIGQKEVVAILQDAGLTIRHEKRLHKHVWSHYVVVADKVGQASSMSRA